jgi:hypothetical protein
VAQSRPTRPWVSMGIFTSITMQMTSMAPKPPAAGARVPVLSVPRVILGRRATRVIPAHRDLKVLRGRRDLLGRRDHPACRALLGRPAPLVQQVRPVPMVRRVLMVTMELPVQMGWMANQCLTAWAHPTRAWVLRATSILIRMPTRSTAQKQLPDGVPGQTSKDQKAIRGKKGISEQRARRDRRER